MDVLTETLALVALMSDAVHAFLYTEQGKENFIATVNFRPLKIIQRHDRHHSFMLKTLNILYKYKSVKIVSQTFLLYILE